MRPACNNGVACNDHKPSHPFRRFQELYLQTFLQAQDIMGQGYNTLIPMCSTTIEFIFEPVDKYRYAGTAVSADEIKGEIGNILRKIRVKPKMVAFHHPGVPLHRVRDRCQQKQFLTSLSSVWGNAVGDDVSSNALDHLLGDGKSEHATLENVKKPLHVLFQQIAHHYWDTIFFFPYYRLLTKEPKP